MYSPYFSLLFSWGETKILFLEAGSSKLWIMLPVFRNSRFTESHERIRRTLSTIQPFSCNPVPWILECNQCSLRLESNVRLHSHATARPEGKNYPCHSYTDPGKRVEEWSEAKFQEWKQTLHSPSALPPKKTLPVPRRLGGPTAGRKAVTTGRIPAGNGTPVVQPATTHFTDWSISAQITF
jgi:hypothetical protein